MHNRASQSKHYHFEQLTSGVYAAIHKEDGWAISNSGIIDLGDRSLVFDTSMTPEAAADLRDVAVELTGNPVTYVVNSHYHNDHIWGNQVFSKQTLILSSTEARRQMVNEGEEEYKYFKKISASKLREMKRKLKESDEQQDQKEIERYLSYYQILVSSMPGRGIRLPDMTFDNCLFFQCDHRRIELITFTGGHTASDAVLYLPDDGIMFTADLLFIDSHPYLPEGVPGSAAGILNQIALMKPNVLVPGHGPIGTISDLEKMHAYIIDLESQARDLIDAGKTEDDLELLPIPEKYAGMSFSSHYYLNLAFVLKSRESPS